MDIFTVLIHCAQFKFTMQIHSRRILSFTCTFLCSVRLFYSSSMRSKRWGGSFLYNYLIPKGPHDGDELLKFSYFRALHYLWKITNWKKRYAEHAIDYSFICHDSVSWNFIYQILNYWNYALAHLHPFFIHFIWLNILILLTQFLTKSKLHIPNNINMKNRVCLGTAVEYIKITRFAS